MTTVTAPTFAVLYYLYLLVLVGVILIQGWGDLAQVGYVCLFLGIAYMAVYAELIGPGVAQ